ncbi:MBL fold metallo-hydrolase [Paenibacillus elgii]|uniref:MBL fold metallo-hydrolase n=1 Tax=Paenibacillus elgii TaxID=189691 RepID=UPI000248C5C0|nr:MBL fold metallo-hydrolase [Paenibacillus elgii]
MKITTLIENLKNDSQDLINESGLSLYIEQDNQRILFDTGKTGGFITNAKKLGIRLEDVDAVVLSHGHHDHGGGLLPFFKVNSKAKVYMKRKASGDYYFHIFGFNKSIGIDKKVFEEYSDRIAYMDHFTEIMNDIYIITDIEEIDLTPKGNKYLFAQEGNKRVQDQFEHELMMVIKEQDGISLFTGCSHKGTPNMIRAAKTMFPSLTIKAVIGGFHLKTIPMLNAFSASQEEIQVIAQMIIDENIQKVYTGHCTGVKAYKKLKHILGSKIEYIRTGSQIHV